MDPRELSELTRAQRLLVESWLPGAVVEVDHSWGLIDTVVLQVASQGRQYIVKASGLSDHHLGREITAHETATGPLLALGSAARLVAADRETRVLVTEYLPGRLVEGTSAERDAGVHRQAGTLLRAFHNQSSRVDEAAEAHLVSRAAAWLDSPHRIHAEHNAQARELLADYRPRSVEIVPTHGDWQPRNWLLHDDRVKVIDFGRFDHRPRSSDLTRLARQQWRDRPDLEAAFFDGYGSDPRAEPGWTMLLLMEAIGTAAWAFQVGDQAFEAQGHRMLAESLAELGSS